jgi:hypothetical protein
MAADAPLPIAWPLRKAGVTIDHAGDHSLAVRVDGSIDSDRSPSANLSRGRDHEVEMEMSAVVVMSQ